MHPVWLSDRSALYYALNYDVLATALGKSLLQFPRLLQNLTTATLILEMLGPLLAIWPARSQRLRLCVVLAFLLFHLALGLSLRLGTFPWVCAAAWMALLPTVFWESLKERFVGPRRGEGDRVIGEWALAFPAKRFLRASQPREPGWVSNVFVLLGLILITLSLLSRHGATAGLPNPDESLKTKLFSLTQLGQSWRMFAPFPSPDDGWYVMEGTQADGKKVDVWNERGEPTDVKPQSLSAYYRNVQWVEYLVLLGNLRYAHYRPYFARYLCRNWNESHSRKDQVRSVTIDFMREYTPPPDVAAERPKRLSGWSLACD
jgi:hypothetical protein